MELEKMKIKLFIDLDQTLFDTPKFKEKMDALFALTGASREVIDQTFKEECEDYKYSVEDNLRRIRTVHEFDLEKILEMTGRLYEYGAECLYGDSIDFLEAIDREKYEVDLLTLGDLEFQKNKFVHLGIEKYFDNVYYCTEQKWDYLDTLVDLNEKFIIIDDRSDTMKRVAEKYEKAVAIHILRAGEIDDEFVPPVRFEGITIQDILPALKYL